MTLNQNRSTYLSVIQDEILRKLYKIIPELQSRGNLPPWDGWRELKIATSDVFGLFTTIENWDSPTLQATLGSLNSELKSDNEKATLAWILVEILALAEALKYLSEQEAIFAFSFSLADRLKLVDFMKYPEEERDKLRAVQIKNVGHRWKQINALKNVARTIFQIQSGQANHPISASELSSFLQDENLVSRISVQMTAGIVFLRTEKSNLVFSMENSSIPIAITVKTIANWRSEFSKSSK